MFFADGQWHREPELAQNFESLAMAVQAAVKYHLDGAQVILQIGDQPNESYDIRLDLLGGPDLGMQASDQPASEG
jgi:hypothetical protein